jgi:hypothetical protein
MACEVPYLRHPSPARAALAILTPPTPHATSVSPSPLACSEQAQKIPAQPFSLLVLCPDPSSLALLGQPDRHLDGLKTLVGVVG